MSLPGSRPVHPCVVNLTDGTRGAEFSTWGYITTKISPAKQRLPNLVTATASTLSVYSITQQTTKGLKLVLEHSFGNVGGTIIFLDTLRSSNTNLQPDALLIAFAGQPRLAVVEVTNSVLRAYSLLDLTPVISDHGYGSASSSEQDCFVTCLSSRSGTTTVACIIGGGIAVVVFTVSFSKGAAGWIADEPYILPMRHLSESLPHHSRSDSGLVGGTSNQINNINQLGNSIVSGFGDIISIAFVSGYLEPVIVLLHTDPGGRTWSGRLGRISGGSIPTYVSALSISVSHQRTALLWCRESPSDSFDLLPFHNSSGGCQLLVVASNTLTVLETGGEIQQVIAMNGFASATCPQSMVSKIEANPCVKLAIQLHGSRIIQISESCALIALRMGQLYILQKQQSKRGKFFVLGLGQCLGSVGEVACLSSSFCRGDNGVFHDWFKGYLRNNTLVDWKSSISESFGFVFAGSRLGDSLLLGYNLVTQSIGAEFTDIVTQSQKDGGNSNKLETLSTRESSSSKSWHRQISTEEGLNRILTIEEEALYADTFHDEPTSSADIVPPSDEETETIDSKEFDAAIAGTVSRNQPQKSYQITSLRSLISLDSITNVGPLGRPCEGPISSAPAFQNTGDNNLGTEIKVSRSIDPIYGASAFVYPCGFATSGGLALVTVPGRDDRDIITEKDCFNVEIITSFPRMGIVLLGILNNGIKALRWSHNLDPDTNNLNEIDISDWCNQGEAIEPSMDNDTVGLWNRKLLGAGELSEQKFVLVTSSKDNKEQPQYWLDIVKETKNVLRIEQTSNIKHGESSLVRLTPFVVRSLGEETVLLIGCLWDSGAVSVLSASSIHGVSSSNMKPIYNSFNRTNLSAAKDDPEDLELRHFYSDLSVTAIDVFVAPSSFFPPIESCADANFIDESDIMKASANPNRMRKDQTTAMDLDEEDQELYGLESMTNSLQKETSYKSNHSAPKTDESRIGESFFLSICRRNGTIEIYSITGSSQISSKCWEGRNTGIGNAELGPDEFSSAEIRLPRSHMVCIDEIRFFFCRPTKTEKNGSDPHSFYMVLESNNMDISLYKFVFSESTGCLRAPRFSKIPIRSVCRPSQEQGRHHSKLIRKGITKRDAVDNESKSYTWRNNFLFRFSGISGQDGIFVASARPFWIVAERGYPTTLMHRTRHSSPSGTRPRPISGFCVGMFGSDGFLTLHERVGQVGSQRLTLFKGISTIFDSYGLLPGSGYCVEKIPMGVTVHSVKFIDDGIASTGHHPLYVVLVSREIEVDQSSWNSDGLTEGERRQMEEEKESAKIQRQVEADLGGFDMESEWVEEIEREECFRISMELGGAPPLRESVYSIWIVDAANKWIVVDSFELGQYEYGIDLQVISLTDFNEDPGAASISAQITEPDTRKKLFIAVGTGTVNHNGEDVASKGRTLLFEIKRNKPNSTSTLSQIAELSLSYEKEIFHGPVTTLRGLESEGNVRLVIGAGSDINIEQWGNGKLTQVGFFRATMQILDITLFKNFFLLSDAYDSLYFLVWRESDKSLTLLAKDYDPIPVYAAGIIARGTAITFLCQDDRQNLQFFQYAPGDAAARGGNKLVCKADFHLGGQTTSFSSYYCRPSLVIHSATPASTMAALKQQDTFFGKQDDDNRLGAHFGTTDGGLVSIVPLSEPVYWRLLALQSVMSNALESDCALSSRDWRLFRRTYRRGGCRSNYRKKGVIDGDLILQFTDLPLVDQEDLASAIGSTVGLILDNLLDVQCASMIL